MLPEAEAREVSVNGGAAIAAATEEGQLLRESSAAADSSQTTAAGGGGGRLCRRWRPRDLWALFLAALVAVATVAMLAHANLGTQRGGALTGGSGSATAGGTPKLEAMMLAELRRTQYEDCVDSPDWHNGFSNCNINGYAGPGCIPQGLTCDAYNANPIWCSKDWALGEKLNKPEKNCCVCGGGSKIDKSNKTMLGASFRAPKGPAWLGTLPPSPDPPRMCTHYEACAAKGLTGYCCPSVENVSLDCCDSERVCVDTPRWTNGFVQCSREGLGKEEGCTSGGVTCEGYEKQGFCSNGEVMKSKEWTLGGRYNHPELNCCACGKHAKGLLGNIRW